MDLHGVEVRADQERPGGAAGATAGLALQPSVRTAVRERCLPREAARHASGGTVSGAAPTTQVKCLVRSGRRSRDANRADDANDDAVKVE